MKKKLVITDKHPDDKPRQRLEKEMIGEPLWHSYVWLNGQIYIIIKGTKTFKIYKV